MHYTLNYLKSYASKLFFTFLLLLVSCPAFGQDESNIYNEEEQKIEEQLRIILGSIRDNYDSQDFVKTISLSQEGRSLSNTKRFYNFYTAISSNLGNALIQIGDTLQATEVLEDSLEKALLFQDTDFSEARRTMTLMTANIDLANLFALTGNYESAIEKYQAALNLSDENDFDGLFILNYNIAESYLELEKPNLSRPFLVESESLSKKINIDVFKASSELLYGKYLFEIESYKLSTVRFEKSIEFAKRINYIEVLIEAYNYWSEAEAKLGNYKKAFELSTQLEVLKTEKFETDRVKAGQIATARFKVDEIKRNAEAKIEAETLKANYKREQAVKEATILWSSIALLMATALIIFLLIGFSKRKRLNKSLIEKNSIYLTEKKKSDRLLTARNALFSRISHELRTPMYGIVGISNILIEDQQITNEQKENIKSLKYSADYLLSLINNVLEMNKLNRSSNISLANEIFDIRELCYHAVESAKYISLDHTNTFHIIIDDNVSKQYKGDAVKLMQVLINLLGNSNKFTKNGEIILKVSKQQTNNDTDLLSFAVKDDGKGISPEKLNVIFDETKFINHNEKHEGTGLGLPISNKILELQDSKLNLTSEEGKGTLVEFDLELQAISLSVNEKGVTKDENITNDLSGKKILIVEDNKINQLVTKKIISSFNGEFEIADSGQEAIVMVQNNGYDLILMDINMPPGMDGFEATREIRKFNTVVPIIALTAVEQIEIEERMKDSLMNDYLIKPFKSEEFIDKILNNIS